MERLAHLKRVEDGDAGEDPGACNWDDSDGTKAPALWCPGHWKRHRSLM